MALMELSQDGNLHWSSSRKVAFRFCFIFFLLFILFSSKEAFPSWKFINVFLGYLEKPFYYIIPWFGKNVFGSEIIVLSPNGSADTTYDYLKILFLLIITLVGGIIWSFLERRKSNYNELFYWLTLIIRFYVALTFIDYGLLKVIQAHFPPPGISRLSETYAESTPLVLAWTYLGYSKGYNIFMGIVELSALLLLFRRTIILGAIITLIALVNILAINYFYDVPVKLPSTVLFIMVLFLLSNNLSSIWKFLFTGQQVRLDYITPPELRNKALLITKPILKYSIIGYALIHGSIAALEFKKPFKPYSTLYGIYDIESIYTADSLAIQTETELQWKQLIIENELTNHIKFEGDSAASFLSKIDTVNKLIHFKLINDNQQTLQFSFEYAYTNPDSVYLKGLIYHKSYSIFMTRRKINDKLTTRKFHWINEQPHTK